MAVMTHHQAAAIHITFSPNDTFQQVRNCGRMLPHLPDEAVSPETPKGKYSLTSNKENTVRTEPVQAHPWQIAAFVEMSRAQYGLCQAPGGSGKSALQSMLGAADLEERPGQKQLILVPQQHIHHGFCGEQGKAMFEVGGRRLTWKVSHNLCEGKRNGRGSRLTEFLLADPKKLGTFPTAISTHQALVSVWQRLTAAERRRALRNLTVRLDEAHHVSGVFAEDDLSLMPEGQAASLIEESTRLGDFCRYVINADDPTCKLHLTTATFFRGDRRAILSESVRDKFVHYNLAWDEYFPTLGIEELHFDYHSYEDDPISHIGRLVSDESGCRHLIILPALNTKFRRPQTLDRLLSELRRIYPASQILDLVTVQTQADNKKLLLDAPEDFHAVVACRLFNEGTDWVICDRLHNADACERSLTLAVQRLYRPLRKHRCKTVVRINNYIPAFDSSVSPEEQRQVLSDRFNAFLVSIVASGELAPIIVPLKAGGTRRTGCLSELYGRETYHELLADLVRGYEAIPEKDDHRQVERLVARLVERYGVPESVEQDELRAALLAQAVRITDQQPQRVTKENMQIAGFDAASIQSQGFDKIWQRQDRHHSLLFYGSENIDAAMIRELLNVLENPLTLDEVHSGIRAHFENTGKRITLYSGYIPELKITAQALHSRLKRSYQTTLSREVDRVLGTAEAMRQDGLIEKAHGLIRLYHERHAVRLTKNHGTIPELGITGIGLQHRLEKLGTSLAVEVDKVLGTDAIPEFPISTVRLVIAQYMTNCIRLGKKFGRIPELGGITGAALNERLKRKYQTTLAQEVATCGEAEGDRETKRSGFGPRQSA